MRHTLKEAARIGAKGSVIALDLYSNNFVKKTGKKFSGFFKPTGEFFHFELDMKGYTEKELEEKIKTFLKECNLSLKKIEIMGKLDDPFGVLVEAVV